MKSIYILLKSRKLRLNGHVIMKEGHTANAYKISLEKPRGTYLQKDQKGGRRIHLVVTEIHRP